MISSKKFLGLSSLLTYSILGLGCDSAQESPQMPVAPHVHPVGPSQDMEELEVIPRLVWSRGLDVQTVTIASHHHPMELELHENRQVVNEKTVVVRDGKETPFEESGLKYPLAGKVAGDPDSRVRLVRTEGGLEGVIFSKGKVFELRDNPSNAGTQRFGEARAMERFGDLEESGARCGLESGDERHAETDAGPSVVARSGKCKETELVVVADHSYVAALKGTQKAEAEMVRRIGEVDAIYRKSVGVRFRITRIYTYEDKSSSQAPEFNKTRHTTPLNEFVRWKGSKEKNADLAHLFVNRTSLGVVGLAKMSGLCKGARAASTSNYRGNSAASTVIVAHEMGHNFGSDHDARGVNSEIMGDTLNPYARSFSSASVNAFNKLLSSVSCLEEVECDESDVKHPQPVPEDTSSTSDHDKSTEAQQTRSTASSKGSTTTTISGVGDSSTTSKTGSSDMPTGSSGGKVSGSSTARGSSTEDEASGTGASHSVSTFVSSAGDTGTHTDTGEFEGETRIVIEGCSVSERLPIGTWLFLLAVFGGRANRRRPSSEVKGKS